MIKRRRWNSWWNKQGKSRRKLKIERSKRKHKTTAMRRRMMKSILKMHLNTTNQELCLRHPWSPLKKMLMMPLLTSFSTRIFHWKNKENFTWSRFQPWSDKFSAQSKEVKVDSTVCGQNTPWLWVKVIDTCWLERRETWTRLPTTW